MGNPATSRLRLVVGGGAPAARPGASSPLTDEQVVALAQAGDPEAFEVLYRRYAEFCLNLAVRIQGNAVDVEDIVHDAFLQAHRRLADLRDRGAFRGWLGAIVVRLVRTRLRRGRLLGALGLASTDPVDLHSLVAPGVDPETRALLAQVYALLQAMPADERIAWTLRHVEHERLEAVAALTECSLATVKRRIQRAQAFLARHFVAPFPVSP